MILDNEALENFDTNPDRRIITPDQAEGGRRCDGETAGSQQKRAATAEHGSNVHVSAVHTQHKGHHTAAHSAVCKRLGNGVYNRVDSRHDGTRAFCEICTNFHLLPRCTGAPVQKYPAAG